MLKYFWDLDLDFKASLLLADIFAGLVGDISLSAWQDKIELQHNLQPWQNKNSQQIWIWPYWAFQGLLWDDVRPQTPDPSPETTSLLKEI